MLCTNLTFRIDGSSALQKKSDDVLIAALGGVVQRPEAEPLQQCSGYILRHNSEK
jgi:hypothetical protein